MNRQELLQKRRLVGWWLDVPVSHLAGSNSLAQHLGNIHSVIDDDAFNHAFKNAKKIDIEKRRRYLKHALSGVAMSEIAKKERVKVGAVSALVRDTLARLALNHQIPPES